MTHGKTFIMALLAALVLIDIDFFVDRFLVGTRELVVVVVIVVVVVVVVVVAGVVVVVLVCLFVFVSNC